MKNDELSQRLDAELISSRESLEQTRRELKSITQDEANDAGGGVPTNHMADYGSQDFERERLMTIEIEYQTRVQMIEDAVARMSDGGYGKCLRCGNAIAPERLDALPWAQYCIQCQEVVENEQDVTGVKPFQPLTP